MYSTIKDYYEYLERLNNEKENERLRTSESVNAQMDIFMAEHGWERKGRGQKISYTKQFNGKPIVIGFRCNLLNGFAFEGGMPEFTHDKAIPVVDSFKMGFFNWNDNPRPSGTSLDEVMERMEEYYNDWTLKE